MDDTKVEGSAEIRASAATTRNGVPVSLNRAPAPDLAPWIARVYATSGHVTGGEPLSCGILADTAIMRALICGKWSARTAEGERSYGRSVLVFGEQTKLMDCSVCGDFRTVGLALRAGAAPLLGGPPADQLLDRIRNYGDLGGNEENLLARFDADASPAEWMDTLEACMRQQIAETNPAAPDAITQAFEIAAFVDPSQPIAAFARQHDISTRQLERIVRRDFGTTPKQVMRRARALDMAANLLGVVEHEEAEELALRYFDQSHLNRDFLGFFGMTPLRFVRKPHPLLTMTIEQRQARRLEVIGRLEEGAPRPW